MKTTRLLKGCGVCLLVLAATAPAKLKGAESPIEGYKNTPILPGTQLWQKLQELNDTGPIGPQGYGVKLPAHENPLPSMNGWTKLTHDLPSPVPVVECRFPMDREQLNNPQN